MAEDVRSDLGYSKELPQNGKRLDLRAPQIHHHESEEATAVRRAMNLEFIFKVFPEAEFDSSGFVDAEMNGKKFKFWPASNTWYSASKDRYGSDIERLCQMIQKAQSLP